MNKKGSLKFEYGSEWSEWLSLVLLVSCFVLAIITKPVINYALIVISGLGLGRYLVRQKKWIPLPTVGLLIATGLGFLLGGFGTNRQVLVALFIASIALTYYGHTKGYVKSKEW